MCTLPPPYTDEAGEIHHEGPMASLQNYASYTEDQHKLWRELFSQQRENLSTIAYTKWLDAMDLIGLTKEEIPRLSDLAKKLVSLTGWQPVPVEGFLEAKDYFCYLANRQFPTVPKLRSWEEFEFIVAPDLFHDAFGHLPMHSHPTFADFLQLYGETALAAKTEEQLVEMQRLYWFSVEYACIWEDDTLKVCGSGHMSGIEESRYTLTDSVKKYPFQLEKVCKQDFNPHKLQPVMFVLDSYEQLYEAMTKKALEFGIPVPKPDSKLQSSL